MIEVFFQLDYKKCLRKSVKLIDAEQLLRWVERTLRRSEPGVDLLRDYRFRFFFLLNKYTKILFFFKLNFARRAIFFEYCRMWFKGSIKRYVLDWINFGLDYDQQEFQFRFNPVHPVAVLKFRRHLWIVCLPGRRREKQGQIIYHKRFDKNGPTFYSCQWSPSGEFLLVLRKTPASSPFPGRFANGDYNSVTMTNFNDYVVHSSCFVLQDKRGMYKFTELLVNYAATPAPDDPHYCQDPFLISSKNALTKN